MASKRGTSIINWLSDVEASSHFSLDSSLRDSSLSCNTHSPPTQQSLSLSSPCRGILQHPRKRKHHPKSPESFSESSHFDRRTRKALCEIMNSNNKNKRRHTDTASEIGEQEFGLGACTIHQHTALSSLLTVTNRIKHLRKAHPPLNPSHGHPQRLSPPHTHLVVPGKSVNLR